MFPLYFLKYGKFSQARNFRWVSLNLKKLIYLISALKCDSFDVIIGIKVSSFRVSFTIEPVLLLAIVRYHELFEQLTETKFRRISWYSVLILK